MAMMSVMAMMLQDAPQAHEVHSIKFAIWIIAGSLLAQAAGVIAAAIYASRFLMKIDAVTKSFDEKTAPILLRTNELLRDLSPKIHTITTNVEQASYTVRAKVDELGVTVSQLNETVAELNGRTILQVRRADAIVTNALEASAEISQTVQQGIRGPVRQIVGVVAGVQAAIQTLVARSPFGRR